MNGVGDWWCKPTAMPLSTPEVNRGQGLRSRGENDGWLWGGWADFHKVVILPLLLLQISLLVDATVQFVSDGMMD